MTPFMGRGTTLIEAALLNRIPYGCDINPLSEILTRPRLLPPTLPELKDRLAAVAFDQPAAIPADLLVFYHPDTLQALINLRDYLLKKARAGEMDHIDAWIRLVATNRLTGHSPGFFSVYTLPPNQAVSVASQIRINDKAPANPAFSERPGDYFKEKPELIKKT